MTDHVHASSAPTSNKVTINKDNTTKTTSSLNGIHKDYTVNISKSSSGSGDVKTTPPEEGISPLPGVVQSSMFNSFQVRSSSSPINVSTLSGVDMEDSFRIVEESPKSRDTVLTPPIIDNSWSNILPNLLDKMDLSTFSECESRLRNLSDDGMKTFEDPVQVRVRQMEEEYNTRIKHLEEKVHRLTVRLRYKSNSCDKKDGGDVEYNEEDVDVESCESIHQVNELYYMIILS